MKRVSIYVHCEEHVGDEIKKHAARIAGAIQSFTSRQSSVWNRFEGFLWWVNHYRRLPLG